ncbi:GntR family transcriptional regulator [Crossiella sp. SN42]|uniref:GntR family transcriptional regulator n=1 Tax=Crossiella sp. SN42 TaxID=2944808 RepID=UPI00207C7FE2|nr:GntR family transcriptional regulator [Crossiella sp. SN42]MCO1577670.1 GntR family transcriptional regulator [Crossiella sp. SN42]
MSIDRSDPRPAYRQVADDLRQKITAGVLKAGDQLPSLSQLMTKYDIAVNTARQALGVLTEEGRIVVRQGQGAFVLDGAADVADDPSGPEVLELFRSLKVAVEDLSARVAAVEDRLSDEK